MALEDGLASCAVFGCGSKGVEVARSVAAALQGGKAGAPHLSGIGIWASYIVGGDAETEYRAIDDVDGVREAPMLLLVLLDQSEAGGLSDAVQICRRARESGTLLSIVIEIVDTGGSHVVVDPSVIAVDDLQLWTDAVVRPRRSTGKSWASESAERFVIAIMSCQGFGVQKFFQWCDIADLQQVFRGNMVADLISFPCDDLPSQLSPSCFEGVIGEASVPTRYLFVSIGGCRARCLMDNLDRVLSAAESAITSVFGDRAANATFVHAAYLDNRLKDRLEMITCASI